jgi:drug/metabolite transporter (DMT)-like permease
MTPPTANRPMSLLAWGLVLGLSALWSGAYFFTGVAIVEVPPLTLASLRVGLAVVALYVALPLLGIAMPTRVSIWAAFAVMGLINNAIPFGLIMWGQTQIGSGLASILNATTPIFTVLIAHVLTTDEKMTPARAAGAALGFAGVAVLIGGDALAGFGLDTIWAQIACLGAAVSYVFAGIFGRRFAKMGLQPLQTAAGQLTCSTAILLPFALYFEQPWTLPGVSVETVGAVVCIAVFSTALAYYLYFRILDLAGPTNLLLVTFIIPPLAIGLGVVLLGETLLLRHSGGLALILCGLACIDGRVFRLLDRKRG